MAHENLECMKSCFKWLLQFYHPAKKKKKRINHNDMCDLFSQRWGKPDKANPSVDDWFRFQWQNASGRSGLYEWAFWLAMGLRAREHGIHVEHLIANTVPAFRIWRGELVMQATAVEEGKVKVGQHVWALDIRITYTRKLRPCIFPEVWVSHVLTYKTLRQEDMMKCILTSKDTTRVSPFVCPLFLWSSCSLGAKRSILKKKKKNTDANRLTKDSLKT